MHGLVIVDDKGAPLRNAIIWCDSRAVDIGKNAFHDLGKEKCATHLLNSPGNFTASKLKWVKDNEPEIYSRIYKYMLPGDYIAYKLSGNINTTANGLSEGILWDYENNCVANWLLNYYSLGLEMNTDSGIYVPAPAVRLMKRRVQSRPGVRQENLQRLLNKYNSPFIIPLSSLSPTALSN